MVSLIFKITVHKRDKEILDLIKLCLGVGEMYEQGENTYVFTVNSIEELKVIIDYFNHYPLITQKRADYEL